MYSMWNCSVPSPASAYATSLDGLATHGGSSAQRENSEANAAASRSLKFGIENILYGSLQSGKSLRKDAKLM